MFATEHPHLVIKLALVGPAGLRDKEHPALDVRSRSILRCGIHELTEEHE
jgi:hypothetical protein